MKTIESKANATYKAFMKLKNRKGRILSKQFIIDGQRIVMHAVEHQMPIEHIVISQTYLTKHDMPLEYSVYVLADSLFEQLVETDNPQGILAIIQMDSKPLGEGKLLFLDEVQDPGNLGTLIRTADAAGFSGVILRKGCTDPYSQKAIRSSMGSIMSIPLLLQAEIEDLNTLNRPIYGAALEGGQGYQTYHYEEDCVLVIGNEGNGISKEVLDICRHKVYIPMIGDVESLNASIAGGILMFEMQKNQN